MGLNIHQKIMFGFVLTVFMLSMYDVLLHLFLATLHILFESAEFILDHLIEGVFEIGNRETEIVVFYILISLIGSAVYKFYCALPRWKDKFKQSLAQQKTEVFMQWQEMSVLAKIAWWSFFITSLNCWLFLT